MNSFYIVFFLALLPSIYLSYRTKELPFFLPDLKTDNEKMLIAASKIKIFSWPSKIHSIENIGEQSRSQSREYWTIMCAVFQKIFRKSKNDHITIMVGLFANFFSTLLIYIIFSNYFDKNIGLISSLLYLTSFWSFHIILFIGHVLLSQLFFLLSILFSQIAIDQNQNMELFFYLLAGCFTLISFQSSSASMKYPPLAILAFLFAIRDEFTIFLSVFELDTFLILIPVILSLSVIYAFIHKKKEVFFKKLIYYLIGINFFIFLLLSLISISSSGLIKIFFFIFGLFLIFLHVTLPIKTFKKNVQRLIAWRGNVSLISHFIPFSNLPIDDQKKIFGKSLPRAFSGGDLFWNLKTYNVFMPFIFPLYVSTVIIFLILGSYEFFIYGKFELLRNFLFLFFISLIPTLIHELTLGLKVAKAYFATILSFIFFIFAFIYNLEFVSLFDVTKYNKLIFYSLYFICGLQFIHSFKISRETLTCRLYVKNLRDFLIKNNILEFNTYDNKYNENFVKNMTSSFTNQFKINIIKNIAELKNKKNKILVVPPITSKVFFFNTDHLALINGYFNEDYELVKIIETKQIEKYSLKKFKTMSSYPYYIYDDEVLSYLSIYQKKITDSDRYKGLGWVLKFNSQ